MCMDEGFAKASQLIAADSMALSESDLNSKGYELLQNEKHLSAIDIFRIAAQAFPESYYSFDSLGEAYMKNGNIELAILNYKKSLVINPENENAKKMIKELEGN